jgi:predicted dehydrogenase
MPTRRTFLEAGLAGAFVNLNPRAWGANERVTLALIGGHNHGRGVGLRTIQAGGRIKTFCDLDEAVLNRVGGELRTAQPSECGFTKEFRHTLDDKEIDAVIIATPDHWHARMALLACQAGKDVYLEKPVSQTIHEGKLIRDAARKYKRVMQIGTMRRSWEHFRTAAEYLSSGALGKVCEIKAWMYQERKSIGRPPDSAPPPGVDYDQWLGPAPKRPFNENRFHYNWRFFWDYGNSELGNQGVHMLDVALWGIQMMRKQERCLPTRVSSQAGIYWLDDAKEVPDTQVVTYDFGNLLVSWELRSFGRHMKLEGTNAGTAFYGVDGVLVADSRGWRVTDREGKLVKEVPASGGSHEGNFLECVKSRQRPNADIEIGRLSTTLTHLGNISHHLKRDVVFDPETETFPGDKQANAYLVKEYRTPYGLPKV